MAPVKPCYLLLLLLVIGFLSRPSRAASSLSSGASLLPGGSLTQGPYLFIMQRDCNLVLYDTNRAIWSSRTNGRGTTCRLAMQSDGNLVIYLVNRAIWASNTVRGQGRYMLVLQPDRNVVIYNAGGTAIWATNTRVGRKP